MANSNDFGTSIWTWTKAGFGISAIGGAVIGGALTAVSSVALNYLNKGIM